MNKIFKYILQSNQGVLNVPSDFRPLKFACIDRTFVMWGSHSENMESLSTQLLYQIVGTGQAYEPYLTYVDTTFDGPYVWHLLVKKI